MVSYPDRRNFYGDDIHNIGGDFIQFSIYELQYTGNLFNSFKCCGFVGFFVLVFCGFMFFYIYTISGRLFAWVVSGGKQVTVIEADQVCQAQFAPGGLMLASPTHVLHLNCDNP